MVLSKDLKIAICFGLIMGAILSLCNLCFAAETESVSFNTVNVGILNNLEIGDTSTFFTSSNSTGYFKIEPGYKYVIHNNSNLRKSIALSNEVPVNGGSFTLIYFIPKFEDYSFTSSEFGYVYLDFYYASEVTVTREKLEGLPNFIDNIAYSLSIGELSSVWVLVVPILAIGVLLALGFYLLKKLLNRIKRAKGGA